MHHDLFGKPRVPQNATLFVVVVSTELPPVPQ
jgi:hypothetical protein